MRHSGDVAVATITWARTPVEELSLRRALAQLAELGLPVAVADRSGSASFTGFLASLPRFLTVDVAASGLVVQVKAAVEAALRIPARFVLYTEPDKEAFFAQHLRAFIARAGERDAGIVLAARSDASFATFPPMQRYTEGVVNHLCGTTIGVPGDYCYGPFLMSRAVAECVARASADLGWGWRPYVFRAAQRCGKGLAHVRDHYCCPTDRREESEVDRVHRLRQLRDNILGLIA